jgi:leucyl/phenylalanyl-tRNA--protein transferase
VPIDPGPCAWNLPDPRSAPAGDEILALGADLEASTLLAAYSSGLFPMHLESGELAWWSPDPRGILEPASLQVSTSLRRSCRRYSVTVDTQFAEVMRGCDERRPESWITQEFVDAYCALHELGWAHSIEVWDHDQLVGGLYGVEMGGLFAGESMFHRSRDASKVALVWLVERLAACPGSRLIDVQWRTDHLATLGVTAIPRGDYLERLDAALVSPPCFGTVNRTA